MLLIRHPSCYPYTQSSPVKDMKTIQFHCLIYNFAVCIYYTNDASITREECQNTHDEDLQCDTTDTEPPLYNEIIFYTLGHSTLKLTEH
jgi:hypothetical protein